MKLVLFTELLIPLYFMCALAWRGTRMYYNGRTPQLLLQHQSDSTAVVYTATIAVCLLEFLLHALPATATGVNNQLLGVHLAFVALYVATFLPAKLWYTGAYQPRTHSRLTYTSLASFAAALLTGLVLLYRLELPATMSAETKFRVILASLSGMLYMVRAAHKVRLQKTQRANTAELLLAAFICLWTLSLVSYVSDLRQLEFHLSLPLSFRWLGVLSLLACLPLSIWTHATLGAHFSTAHTIQEGHLLISDGPYEYIRHPMYATLFLCLGSVSLITADLVVLSSSVLVYVAMRFRIQKEEALLHQRFAETYGAYIKKTGALLPKKSAFS